MHRLGILWAESIKRLSLAVEGLVTRRRRE
jgi:hypothetical protein